MEVDRHSDMRVLAVFEDAVFEADGNTQSIDLGEFNLTLADAGAGAKSLEYVVAIGTIPTASGSIDCRLQEADAGGGPWTNVPNAEVVGGEDLTNELTDGVAAKGLVIPIGAVDEAYRIGSISKKQFQRMALTQETNVTAGQVSVVAILQDFRHGAQADQSS